MVRTSSSASRTTAVVLPRRLAPSFEKRFNGKSDSGKQGWRQTRAKSRWKALPSRSFTAKCQGPLHRALSRANLPPPRKDRTFPKSQVELRATPERLRNFPATRSQRPDRVAGKSLRREEVSETKGKEKRGGG